jgi:hypothetical protein
MEAPLERDGPIGGNRDGHASTGMVAESAPSVRLARTTGHTGRENLADVVGVESGPEIRRP